MDFPGHRSCAQYREGNISEWLKQKVPTLRKVNSVSLQLGRGDLASIIVAIDWLGPSHEEERPC